MGLFDLAFDELGKQIKEAPGWLSVVIGCNLLLFIPGVGNELERISISKEETTVATLVAMALFFLGDVVDSFVFPRERDGKRSERVLKGLMLLLGAFAVFFFLVGHWWSAAALAFVWIVIIPIYDTRRRPLSKECDDDLTGFEWLVPQYGDLKSSTETVRGKLNIPRGTYKVSQALARKAKRYTISIWLPNEAAKQLNLFAVPSFQPSSRACGC